MAVDGQIKIRTKIDSKGFNTGMRSMMASLGKLAGAIGLVFSITQLVNFGKQSVEVARKFEERWQGLAYLIRAKGLSFQEAKSYIEEYTSDGLVPVMNATKAYMNLLATGFKHTEITQLMQVMKDSAVYLRKGQFEIGEAVEKTTEGIRTERSILSDTSGIERNLYKMWQDYAISIGKTISSLSDAEKRQAVLNGYLKEGAVYAGAAAQYVNTYAGRTAQLAFAMTQLKEAVGNALIPVINKLLPYIIRLVTWFTKLFNIIGRVLNLLFGTQVTMEDVGDSAGGLGDDASDFADGMERGQKAAKGALAAFDKIDVLNKPTGSSGGGGGGEELPPVELPDTGGFLEELDEIEEKLRAFVARIKALFESGDWEGIGALLAYPFNWGMGKIEEWLVNSTLPEKVSNFARILNGFIVEIDWLKFGQNVSNGLSLAIRALTEFFTTFDFKEAGASISEFINGIDWVKLAGDLSRGIWSVVTSVFNLLLGFIKELDWKKLGNDAWNAVVTFITEYDFESLWKLAFETFGAALGGVLNLAVGLVEGIWNTLVEAWNASEGYFAPFIEEAGGNVSLGLLNGIISGLGDIAKWVYETIVSPFMTVLLESFGVEWTTVEEWFVQAWNDVSGWAIQAWEDIKEVWNTVATWFDENVIQPLVDFFTPIVTWFENDIIKPLKEKWDGLVKSFRELVGVIKEKVIDPIVRFYENVLYPKIKVVLEWLGNLFSTVWNAIKTVILTVVGAIWAGLQVAWGWIKAGFETAFNTIKTIFMTVYNVIASIAGMVIGVFDGIIQFVTGIFTGDWDKAWEGIKTIFTSIWEGIRDTIKGVINGIIGFINGMIQGIVSGINAVIGVLNKLNIHIPDWVPLFGNKSIGFNIAPISAPQIPLLATGAVIPANAPFLAVLGDQKHGRNIEAPESMLRDLIREELSKHNGGQQEITVKFAGTMGALVRAMQPYLESEQVRRGQSFAKAVRVS